MILKSLKLKSSIHVKTGHVRNGDKIKWYDQIIIHPLLSYLLPYSWNLTSLTDQHPVK